MEKFIIELKKEDTYSEVLKHDKNITKDLLSINNDILEICNNYKNKIEKYYENKKWEKYKKLLYNYENISKIKYNHLYDNRCVSRGYYKLQEILYDFNYILPLKPINALFLSEGPGGFFQCFIENRHKLNIYNDKIYGITLKENNDNIPDWKLPYNIKKYINITYGKDNTGNLYNYENIEYLVSKLGKNNIEFITSDGGFDFSNNFNEQEKSSIKLLLCEILCALLLQKENGSFIIKIYDIFSDTIKLIHILKKYYKNVFITKPLSSRPANSEKYIVCIDFNNNNTCLINYIIDCIKKDSINIQNIIEYDNILLTNLVSYNLYYSITQIYNIQNIIDNIDKNNIVINDKSKEWHDKYMK